jgi:preprotein translocase subunit SecD
MLYFSRMRTAAILLTVLVVCGFAVPNLFSEETTRNWPSWAQGRLVLAPELQGGSSFLLEVDRDDIRAQLLESLSQEVRRTLREAHIGWAIHPVVRANGVEVRLSEDDFEAGFALLHEMSQPFNGIQDFDVVDAGGGRVRLTPTEAAIAERAHLAVDIAMPIIERRYNQLGIVGAKATVQRQGSDRLLVQMPGLGDPRLLVVE